MTYLGVRSVRMRAKFSHGPARSSGWSSRTNTLETRSRARPNAVASPPCPPPTMTTSRTSTSEARPADGIHGRRG